MAGANVTEVSESTFDQEVVQSAIPVVVDFFTSWCGPCKMIAPLLEEIGAEMAGKVKIAKVDAEANPSLAAKFRVASVPTLAFFKGGLERDRFVGGRITKRELIQKISAQLD